MRICLPDAVCRRLEPMPAKLPTVEGGGFSEDGGGYGLLASVRRVPSALTRGSLRAVLNLPHLVPVQISDLYVRHSLDF